MALSNQILAKIEDTSSLTESSSLRMFRDLTSAEHALQNLDDALPDADSLVDDPVQEARAVDVKALHASQGILPDQVHDGLAHRDCFVRQAALNGVGNRGLQHEAWVLLDDHRQRLERSRAHTNEGSPQQVEQTRLKLFLRTDQPTVKEASSAELVQHMPRQGWEACVLDVLGNVPLGEVHLRRVVVGVAQRAPVVHPFGKAELSRVLRQALLDEVERQGLAQQRVPLQRRFSSSALLRRIRMVLITASITGPGSFGEEGSGAALAMPTTWAGGRGRRGRRRFAWVHRCEVCAELGHQPDRRRLHEGLDRRPLRRAHGLQPFGHDRGQRLAPVGAALLLLAPQQQLGDKVLRDLDGRGVVRLAFAARSRRSTGWRRCSLRASKSLAGAPVRSGHLQRRGSLHQREDQPRRYRQASRRRRRLPRRGPRQLHHDCEDVLYQERPHRQLPYEDRFVHADCAVLQCRKLADLHHPAIHHQDLLGDGAERHHVVGLESHEREQAQELLQKCVDMNSQPDSTPRGVCPGREGRAVRFFLGLCPPPLLRRGALLLVRAAGHDDSLRG
eukprot:scaffold1696_cov258-Pinguiococcus_pyrenoidosus.AAC.9